MKFKIGPHQQQHKKIKYSGDIYTVVRKVKMVATNMHSQVSPLLPEFQKLHQKLV